MYFDLAQTFRRMYIYIYTHMEDIERQSTSNMGEKSLHFAHFTVIIVLNVDIAGSFIAAK